MEKKNLKIFSGKESGTWRLTNEQLAEGRKHMKDAFARLLAANEKDDIRWMGTQTDLMELAYLAYESGEMRDERGFPLTLAQLVREACNKLHVRQPYSPYNAAARARRRKGVRCHTLLERFCWLKFVAREDNPLTSELQKRP